MSTNESLYLNLLRHVLDEGIDRPDRTGTGVRSLFGTQLRFDLKAGFPLLTTKKMNLASISSELLWFIEGSGDERRLAEIRFGKDRSELTDKRTIWTDNAESPYWKDNAKFPGDLGRVYGAQWRYWRSPVETGKMAVYDDGINNPIAVPLVTIKEVDQLVNLIDGIKKDPFGRRHIVSAWNPGELDQMALPPCHTSLQLYVSGDKLSGHFQMRSTDVFLGLPYNIASYALFVKMIAQVCGLTASELIYTGGDVHIYHNHFDAVREQLSRAPKIAPQLFIDPSVDNIDDFTMDHFELIGYDPHPIIKAPMAV